MMTLMVMMLMTTMLMMMAIRTRMTMWWDGDAHSCSPQGGQVAQLNPEHQFPFSTSSSASLTNIAHGNVRSPLLWCAFVLWCVISERMLDTNEFELKDQGENDLRDESHHLLLLLQCPSLTNIAQGNVHFICFRVHLFCDEPKPLRLNTLTLWNVETLER